METLPPEIAGIVCDHLDQADIPAMRLVSKFWNDVASPYLLHKPKLIFRQASFDRLLDISKHPFFRTLVTGLIYEPNTLDMPERHDWERSKRVEVTYSDDLTLPPGPNPTERDWRAYSRNGRKARKEARRHSREEMDKAWIMYGKYYQEQEQLRERGYGHAELCEAMKNLPNLRKVSMNHGWELWIGKGYSSDEDINPYAQALASAGPDDSSPALCGVPQMHSLILAIHQAHLQLRSLRIGSVSWRFLMLEHSFLEKLREVLAPLDQLELHISTSYHDEYEDEDDEDGIGQEIPDCRDFLDFDRSNTLHRLLTASSNIKYLYLAFDWSDPFAPADFDNLVLMTHWPFLNSLTIENMELSKDRWLEFLERHSTTLKHIGLYSIELSHGKWVDVLETMQQTLKLSSMYFGHRLTGLDPQQFWNLETDIWASRRDMRSQGNRTRKALEEFFVNGGLCPLRDEDAHPNGVSG